MIKKIILSTIVATLLFTGCEKSDSSTPTSTPTPTPISISTPTSTPTPPPNQAPKVFAGQDRTVTVNQTITLKGEAKDSDGSISIYEWKKGDNTLGLNQILKYTPTKVGIEILTLIVTDNRGKSNSDTIKITIKAKSTSEVLSGDSGKNNLTENNNSKDNEAVLFGLNTKEDNLVFTSSDTIEFMENSTQSIKLSATSKSHVTFDIQGEDKRFFHLYQNQEKSSATLNFNNAPDFETRKEYKLTVEAKDEVNNKTFQELTIKIQNVDEIQVDTTPPKFSNEEETFVINENEIYAGKVVATDTNRINYYISGGKDANSFTIDDSVGTLEFKTPPNYEVKNSYETKVTAKDTSNNKSEQLINVKVKDVDDTDTDITPPILRLPTVIKVYENETYVIRIEATDINSITYSIRGTDVNSFTIDNTTGDLHFKNAPDYETKKEYYLDILATDSKGNVQTQYNIKILILDIYEPILDTTAPIFTSLNKVNVNENQTSALTLKATDENSVTYSISGGDSSSFYLNSSTGVLQFKSAPDYETKNRYTFTAKATDSKGNVRTQNIQINITDLYEPVEDTTPPTFISVNQISVNENQISALTLQATDENSITYSINGTDANYFNSNSTTGVIVFKSAPDYETKKSYIFTAIATDKKGNKTTQSIKINILDLYEPVDDTPTVISVTPLNSYLNVKTIFSITGKNLPSTLATYISNCMYLTTLSKSPTQMKFSCTPTGIEGEEEGLVKDKSGGTILENFTLSVVQSVFKLSHLEGTWEYKNFYYSFDNKGRYTYYKDTGSCYKEQFSNQFNYSNGTYHLSTFSDNISMSIKNNIWTATNETNGKSITMLRKNFNIDFNNICQ